MTAVCLLGAVVVWCPLVSAADDETIKRLERELAETQAAVRALETKQPAQGSGARSNPDISLDGLFAAAASTAPDLETLETGAHDPNQRGFTVQNLELTLSGTVDPYFTAIGHLIFGIDREGESFLEVEEAYMTTSALPANLQLRAGQFFTQFGRLNPTHPHTWSFVDQPLINGRMFGGDGMRAPGLQVSYLIPLPVYAEAMLALQDSQGETMFSFRGVPGEDLFGRAVIERQVEGIGDLVIAPRLATSFNPSDTQTVLFGVSGAFGPNGSGESARTQIYGMDLYYKWKPIKTIKGWPFVAWQTEVMKREYDNAAVEDDPTTVADESLPEEQLQDWGGYTQVMWGFTPRWVAGLRGEYVAGEGGDLTDPLRERRNRFAPSLTFYPSEFSKWRVQYNRDDVDSREDIVHSVFLQWEFLIGSHGAHTF
ncbi:MAG: hypothetical protein ACOYXU_02315 [Nitrospirota bacterium]